MSVLVIAEHRRGELRDITFEMLCKGNELAKNCSLELISLLLGSDLGVFANKLAHYSDKVLVVEDAKLTYFNSELYQKVLKSVISTYNPKVIMIGHTAVGMDLAPAIATELQCPLATDCIDFDFDGKRLTATRQMYSGKINAKITSAEAERFIVSVRPGAFQAVEEPTRTGKIITVESPVSEDIDYKKFIDYIEAAVGAVDITRSDIIVAVGRGVKEKENLGVIEELAETLGGVVACSRPIVDKQWLTPDRQVGTSGRTVKPKLYIACGISGAFQHVVGMKNSGTIVAINKDPNAPIFEVAHYSIVGDMFKIVPALTETLRKVK